MRGAGIRGLGALIAAAAIAASCGWPEYAFETRDADGQPQGGENSAGAGASSGGSAGSGGALGGAGGRGGTSPRGGMGGESVPDECDNGSRDPAETDVDCGGETCPACGPGNTCLETGDCAERICTSHGVCEFLFCGDGEANESETDADCGGPDCERRCPEQAACRSESDCAAGLVCENGTCGPGACDPALGPCSSRCRCENGVDCLVDDDCASGNCAGGSCSEGARVFSRNDEPNAAVGTTPAILQTFFVRNDGPSELPLGELTLRYFFSSDAVGEQIARCDQARAAGPDACSGVVATLGEVSTPFADRFVEVRFPSGALLAAGADTRQVPITVEPTSAARYSQNDDYSLAGNLDFAANARVTLYRQGVLVWGEEP